MCKQLHDSLIFVVYASKKGQLTKNHLLRDSTKCQFDGDNNTHTNTNTTQNINYYYTPQQHIDHAPQPNGQSDCSSISSVCVF